MFQKQISATISFKVFHGEQSVSVLNKDAILDFVDSCIVCETTTETPLKIGSASNVILTALSIDYCKCHYDIDVSCLNLEYSYKEHDKVIILVFSFEKNILSIPRLKSDNHNYRLVFLGARNKLNLSINYNGQVLRFYTQDEFLNISSEEPMPEKISQFTSMAYSLFQNSEIKLLEEHSPNVFKLYIQFPAPPGRVLCYGSKIFEKIWNWVVENDESEKKKNAIDFFISGAKLTGESFDFRLMKLFVAIDAICKEKGKALYRCITKEFSLDEADGVLIANVRNAMIHDGVDANSAIESVLNKKLIKFDYIKSDDKDKKVKFYCGVIDLIVEYFMTKSGVDYENEVHKMLSKYFPNNN